MTRRLAVIGLVVLAVLAAGGWFLFGRAPTPERWLGYADADFVKLAPTLQGRLTDLAVHRGDRVAAGDPLFAQDEIDDRGARDQAAAELGEAREKLADLQAGGRSAEIVQAEADVADMHAGYERVARDLARNEAIVGSGAATRQTVDQLRADTRSAEARLRSSEAKLALIRDTSGRAHAIAAQQAAVAADESKLVQADWRLDQRRVTAPTGGLIADTYARPGETIAAGASVVSLLAPENVLVRFFVPEAALNRLHAGDRVGIACDACPKDLTARVSFVATAPEYTPPVIYSEGTRGTLVYLIEARPNIDRALMLKPGQPVDVLPAGGPHQ